MKQILILTLLLSTSFWGYSQDDEISLFNSKGKPIAYIDTDDDDLTIYLWKPVAYLYKSDGEELPKNMHWIQDPAGTVFNLQQRDTN